MALTDLQTYVPDKTPVSARDMNTLGQLVKIVRGLAGAGAFIDETGIAFRPQTRASANLTLRVASAFTGQGKYQCYVTSPKIDTTVAGTNIGTLKNVFVGDTVGWTDGEEVSGWNLPEFDDATSPVTGADRVHLLQTGNNYVMGGIFLGADEIKESSTNRLRIVLFSAVPSFGCRAEFL